MDKSGTDKKDDKKRHADDIIWTPEQEELLAEWSEKATCYRWLHSRSEKLYRKRNYTYTIPVIILSTLTGTANFAMDSFVPEEHKQIAMAAVGGTNIFAGILSTLQNFLRYAELMENHRLSELQWSKFGRNIAVELALNPNRRQHALDFLKICRAEYDRLIEQSPTIDDSVIKQFKKQFKDTDLKKPDTCNGLERCKIYKPSKDEQVATIMASAGSKFKLKPKINAPEKAPTIGSFKNESIHELNGLKGLGKVSQFKTKMSEADNGTKHEKIEDELKSILKNDLTDVVVDENIKDDEKEEEEKEEKEEDKIKIDIKELSSNFIKSEEPKEKSQIIKDVIIEVSKVHSKEVGLGDPEGLEEAEEVTLDDVTPDVIEEVVEEIEDKDKEDTESLDKDTQTEEIKIEVDVVLQTIEEIGEGDLTKQFLDGIDEE